ncbi:MAG: hypothetical protein N3G75_06255 [Methanothrix sp.]|nr:hypothetical protein [Methanothrix sp.]MCX8207417.1 hypothetical protein [Methanothrix sp.]
MREVRVPMRAHTSGTSVLSAVISDLKKLVATEFTYSTRWEVLQRLYELDPEIQAGIDLIAHMIHAMYAGPAMSRLGTDQPGEMPEQFQREFLERVDSILDELRFSQRLPTIIKLLLRDGNAIFRIHRRDGRIHDLELLPVSVVTILSRDRDADVIRDRDYYAINEKSPWVASEIIPSSEILHFSLNADGNLVQDRLGRWTFSVWGRSPLESLVFIVKRKAQTLLDYFRWSRVSMPRLEAVLDISVVGNPDNYTGTPEERVMKAQDAVKQVFRDVERALYYKDTDPSSPTFGKELPIEPDHIFAHSNEIEMRRLEGSSPYPEVTGSIQDCNRSIAARLGIPLSALGYEEGSTRAIGEVTRYYMHTSGNGLLRSLESDLERFFRLEFESRGWPVDDGLIADFYLKTEFSDPDAERARAEMERVKYDTALAAYRSQILTKNEARKMLGLSEVQGGDVFYIPTSVMKAASLTASDASRARDSDPTIDSLADEVRKAYESETKWLINEILKGA